MPGVWKYGGPVDLVEDIVSVVLQVIWIKQSCSVEGVNKLRISIG